MVEAPLLLIVEDDGDTRELYATFLTDAGYRVASASLGTEALRLASALQPDLIVLDVALGGLLTGYDVCRSLRGEPRLAGTAILIVSGFATSEDQAQAREVGGDAFLSKPCAPDALLAAIRSLLESAPQREKS